MLRTLRSPLAIAQALSLAPLTGCGSGGDPQTSESGLPKEIAIAAAGAPIAEEHIQLNFTLCGSEPGYGPPYTGRRPIRLPGDLGTPRRQARRAGRLQERRAAAGQLTLDAIRETGTTDGAKLATALEAKSHPTVLGPLSYTRDDHLPSGPWYIYEYPDRKPKLLERVKPAYLPEYEQ